MFVCLHFELIITARKQSVRRLCFHRRLSVHRRVSAFGPGRVSATHTTPHPGQTPLPLGRHPPGQTPLLGKHPHLGRHPPLSSACWDTVNKRAVCIPLECILVEDLFPVGAGGMMSCCRLCCQTPNEVVMENYTKL